MNKEFNNSSTQTATSTVDFIFKSDTMSVSDTSYKDAVTTALAPVKGDSRVVSIFSPYNVPTPQAAE